MSTQIATPSSRENQKEKKNKWRLSNPFGHKEAGNETQTLNPNTRDSAYGGSETTSDTSPNPSSHAIPTITQNQADMQGAPVETKTDARGRVITTTTTTVTTTTTTTAGDSLEVPAGEEVIVRKEEHTALAPPAGPQELSAQSKPSYIAPSIPTKNDLRNRSPHGGHLAPHSEYPAEPSSPTHQNFSYPGRQSFSPIGRGSSFEQQHPKALQPGTKIPTMDPSYGRPPLDENTLVPPYNQQPGNRPRPPIDPSLGQQPLRDDTPVSPYSQQAPQNTQYPARDSISSGYPPRQSTAQSIRTAAAGIHGAGEALRGALNTSVAKRTGGTAEEIAQHAAVAERGRREVETGQFQRPPAAPVAPAVPESLSTDNKEKKSRGLRNVLRKKSQERTA